MQSISVEECFEEEDADHSLCLQTDVLKSKNEQRSGASGVGWADEHKEIVDTGHCQLT